MKCFDENIMEMFVKPVLFQIDSNDTPYVESEYSLGKVLEFNKDIVVTGAPGAGKTTLLKYIEHVLKKSDKFCTIFISLRDVQYINNTNCGGVDNKRTKVFLLDGFDEVPVPERNEVILYIEKLKNAHPQSRLVITSRLYEMHEFLTLKHLVILRIADFNDAQLEQLFKLHGVSDYEPALITIKSSVALRGAARNPFMAKLIIQYIDVIASNDYIIDPTLYLDRFINEYIYKTSGSIGIHPELIDSLLGEIAGLLHYKESHQFSIEEIESLLHELHCDSKAYLDFEIFIDAMKHGYVFVEIETGLFSFAHKNIFEYFLTKHLRNLVGYREGRLILDSSQSVLTAIKLKGLRDKVVLRKVLLGIEKIIGHSITPIYAKEGSIEILLALQQFPLAQ